MTLKKEQKDLLRRRAERILKMNPDQLSEISPERFQTYMHELQVFQVELELQNEELAKTQEMLEDSRKEMLRLYNQAPVGYVVLDGSGLVRKVNDTFCRMMRNSADSMRNKAFASLLEKESAHVFRSRFRSFFRNPDNKQLELQLQREDGSQIYAMVETTPDSENKSELRVMISDISSRKQTETAYLRFCNLTNDMICVADLHSARFIQVNPAFTTVLGYSEGELLDQPFLNFVHPDDLERTKETTMRMIEFGERSVVFENRYRCKDGGYKNLEWNSHPVKDEGLVYAIAHDISDRKRLDSSMQTAARLKSLGLLAGGIAHDFNNLLTGMFGYVELAMEVGQIDDVAREHLEQSMSVFLRARDLTRQLLTFSKGRSLHQESLQPVPLIQQTTEFVLSGSSVEVDFHIGDHIPNIWADPHQISQVLENIILNAKQAMNGQGKIEVSVLSEYPDAVGPLAREKHLKIVIADDGPGIGAEVLPHIFDPFFSTKDQGNGLGLATSYSIIQQHQGDLVVDSIEGQGSAFTLWLPLASGVEKKRQVSLPKKSTEQLNVLVMDDEGFILTIAQLYLEKLGHQVETCRSGEEALEYCKKAAQKGQKPDLAILDLTVPGGKGGREISGELRDLYPQMILVASSGYSDDAVMANPGDFDFHAALPKPYQLDHLATFLAELFSAAPVNS